MLETGAEYPSVTVKLQTACGAFYITLVYDLAQANLLMVSTQAGKAGGCVSTQLSTFVMLINDMLVSKPLGSRIYRYSLFQEAYCNAGTDDCCVRMIAELLLSVEHKLDEQRSYTPDA